MSIVVRYSKFLSLILRHRPEEVGVTLDPAGWVDVDVILAALQKRTNPPFTRELLVRVVQENDKKRFEFNEDQTRIRASQGHSVQVDLEYAPIEPPEFLFHGTVDRVLDSIRAKGLIKGDRHHVHLSLDRETASKVGSRRGRPVVLRVRAQEMHQAGAQFFRSTNGVWLTEHVPADKIEFP